MNTEISLYVLSNEDGDLLLKSSGQPYAFCSREKAREKKRALNRNSPVRILRFEELETVR